VGRAGLDESPVSIGPCPQFVPSGFDIKNRRCAFNEMGIPQAAPGSHKIKPDHKQKPDSLFVRIPPKKTKPAL
jgi:hypothetical protein